jgi:hypothetical protein
MEFGDFPVVEVDSALPASVENDDRSYHASSYGDFQVDNSAFDCLQSEITFLEAFGLSQQYIGTIPLSPVKRCDEFWLSSWTGSDPSAATPQLSHLDPLTLVPNDGLDSSQGLTCLTPLSDLSALCLSGQYSSGQSPAWPLDSWGDQESPLPTPGKCGTEKSIEASGTIV